MNSDNFGLNNNYTYHEFQFDSGQTSQSISTTYASTNTSNAAGVITQPYQVADWPVFQLGKPIKNIAALKVLECQIPFSFYTVNAYNNTFVLFESDKTTNGQSQTAPFDTSQTVTLPSGNYNSSTILTALASALNATSASMAADVSGTAYTYTVTYNATTQRLTISSNAGAGVYFQLTFGTSTDPGWTNPRQILGAIPGQSIASNQSGTLYTFTVTALSSTLTAGATYTNNSKTFTVSQTYLAGVTSIVCTGTGAPTASGTLTLASGSGQATISFSAAAAGTAGSASLVLPNAINLTGPNYLYLNSTTFGPLIKLYQPANYGGNYGTGQLSGADGPQIAKIPITVQPGGTIYWQDPNPIMWFDVGNLQSLNQNLDFYLTAGDNPQPLYLNGGVFSIKLGILENITENTVNLGGGVQNNRVQSLVYGKGTNPSLLY